MVSRHAMVFRLEEQQNWQEKYTRTKEHESTRKVSIARLQKKKESSGSKSETWESKTWRWAVW